MESAPLILAICGLGCILIAVINNRPALGSWIPISFLGLFLSFIFFGAARYVELAKLAAEHRDAQDTSYEKGRINFLGRPKTVDDFREDQPYHRLKAWQHPTKTDHFITLVAIVLSGTGSETQVPEVYLLAEEPPEYFIVNKPFTDSKPKIVPYPAAFSTPPAE